MKKLLTLALGLSLAFTTVAVTFAQDAPKKEERSPAARRAEEKGRDPQEGRRPLGCSEFEWIRAARAVWPRGSTLFGASTEELKDFNRQVTIR